MPSAPAPARSRLSLSSMMSALALLAGLAEAEQVEAFERQHLEAGRAEEIRQAAG